MISELDKKAYEIYTFVDISDSKSDNYVYIPIYDFIRYKNDKDFKKYYRQAIIDLRIEKLKNIEKKYN